MIFIIRFVDMVYHTDWFVDIKNSCIPGANPTWPWYKALLMCCIQVASTLLNMFGSMSTSDIGL